MLIINIVLVIFIGLIFHHILYKINIIEGLDDKDEYIPPPKDSTEYTAAEVAAQLEQIKKRESKYQIQMKELGVLKKKMDENTATIIEIQKGLAETEAANSST
jgi:hypothetical protein